MRTAVSALSLIAIFTFDLLTRESIFTWSLTAIPKIEDGTGDWLKIICLILWKIGGQVPNIIVVLLFTAMFKRRHQAFSYLLLWSFQVFIETFSKFAMREPRPSMVVSPVDGFILWTPYTQIISLGSPCNTSLSTMCITLSFVIEYIYHTEEQSEHNNIRLSISQNETRPVSHGMDSSARSGEIETYPLWKKVLLISGAIFYSFIEGFSRFIIGAHSLDQVIFGWLIGAWLALTFFGLIREHIHRHVTDLISGRTSSSTTIYYLISTGIWLTSMLTITITFLIVKNKDLNLMGQELRDSDKAITSWVYWTTWAESGYTGAVLGGYFGLL